MTALLDAPAEPVAAPRPPAPRRALLLVAGLLSAAVALLVVAGLRAAPGLVDLAPVAPQFAGSAPQVTLPTYGVKGTHVLGYEHGASARLSLPLVNDSPLPVTVTAVDLGGGVAPLLEVQGVEGLPVTLPPGGTRTVEVSATLANCRFFHEREVQNYASLRVELSVLGQRTVRDVPYDRPVMVRSPMIVGCPDRLLDRQANDRTDLVRAS